MKNKKINNINIDTKDFQQNKISILNHFFMRNIILGNLFALLMFVIAVGLLLFILFMPSLDSGIKITLISMIATYTLTTSKTFIDKSINSVQYLITLLSEEQRGLSKDLGIDIEKIDFNQIQENNDEE